MVVPYLSNKIRYYYRPGNHKYHVCFADITSQWHYFDEITMFWRLAPEGISKFKANWFYKNYIVPNIPDRMKPWTKITPLSQKHWNDEGFEAKNPDSAMDDVYPINKEIAWKKLVVKCKPVDATDMYCLMSMLRMPQELPNRVMDMYDYVMKGLSFDQAMVEGYRKPIREGGCAHEIMSRYLLGNITDAQRNKFSMEKLWDGLCVGEPKRQKKSLENAFLRALGMREF